MKLFTRKQPAARSPSRSEIKETKPARASAPRRFWRRCFRIGCVLVGAWVLFIAFSNYYIIRANRDYLYEDRTTVPAREVGLVLGASSHLANGSDNLHFVSRIEAAAALYHAGKVRQLLVSGDNHRVDYDEPGAMKNALIARGVPAEIIMCDYAGFRTYDSMIRAKKIFGVTGNLTIITQRYHNARAVAIARANGIDAIGFCAEDVEFRHSIRTEIREVASRTFAVLEIFVFPHNPRYLGPEEKMAPAAF